MQEVGKETKNKAEFYFNYWQATMVLFFSSGIFHSMLAKYIFHNKSRNRKNYHENNAYVKFKLPSKKLCTCLFPPICNLYFKQTTQLRGTPCRRAGFLPVVSVRQEKQGQRQVELRSGPCRCQTWYQGAELAWVEVRTWVNCQRHQVQTRSSQTQHLGANLRTSQTGIDEWTN